MVNQNIPQHHAIPHVIRQQPALAPPRVSVQNDFFDTALQNLSLQIETMSVKLAERMDLLEEKLENKITQNITQKMNSLIQEKVDEGLGSVKRDVNTEFSQ